MNMWTFLLVAPLSWAISARDFTARKFQLERPRWSKAKRITAAPLPVLF